MDKNMPGADIRPGVLACYHGILIGGTTAPALPVSSKALRNFPILHYKPFYNFN
jgi:hypothetical protein